MSLARDTADYGHIKTARGNLLRNPNFDVWQRGVTSVAHTAGDYLADGWFGTHGGTMVYTLAKLTESSTSLPFDNYHRLDVTTADTSVAAGDYCHVTQKIEGLNMKHLNWGKAAALDVTLSFWHRHTKTGTHSVSIRNGNGSRCYVAEYTQAVTNTWEQAEVTIPGCTDGTWAADNTTGLVLTFAVMCGSTYSGTAGSWLTSGNIFSSANQVNNVDNTSNVFDLAHVKLEVGTEATDFEPRPIAEELAVCQRYFEKSCSHGLYFGNLTANGSAYGRAPLAASYWPTFSVYFRVSKAGIPDVTIWAPGSGTTNKIRDITAGTDLSPSLLYQNENSFSARSSDSVSASDECAFQWYADAEL